MKPLLLSTILFAVIVFGQREANPYSAERASELEAKVEANPEDVGSRIMLLQNYAFNHAGPEYVRNFLWMITNHPDNAALGALPQLQQAGGVLNTPYDYEQAKRLWETQLAKHSETSAVLLNAARFNQAEDPERAIELIENARKLTPHNTYTQIEARIYVRMLLENAPRTDQSTASAADFDTFKTRLLSSGDAELLNDTGVLLSNGRAQPEIKELGVQLIEKAIEIDPTNAKWHDSLRVAMNPPAQNMDNAERIGGAVAEANLVKKVEPVYPELARSARIQGTVEFTAVIGEDGKIISLQLVRGHPLLVNAAKEAVLQWVYRPTLLNGRPVKVITDVVANFALTAR
jgi:TonB family protein